MLGALGFTLPSPAYIVGVIVFGVIGLVAYYCRQAHRPAAHALARPGADALSVRRLADLAAVRRRRRPVRRRSGSTAADRRGGRRRRRATGSRAARARGAVLRGDARRDLRCAFSSATRRCLSTATRRRSQGDIRVHEILHLLPVSIAVGVAARLRRAAVALRAEPAARFDSQVDLHQGPRRLRCRPHRRRPRDLPARKPVRRRPSASATRSTPTARRARTRSIAATLVPAKDKADCLARIEGPSAANQKTTTSGSVAGGGVLRETTTTTTGTPTVIVVPRDPGGEPR